jgi:hypothetical protein
LRDEAGEEDGEDDPAEAGASDNDAKGDGAVGAEPVGWDDELV